MGNDFNPTVWLGAKECVAKLQAESESDPHYSRRLMDEAGRCRSVIDELTTLRTQLTAATARISRLRAECLAWRNDNASSPKGRSWGPIAIARAACDTHHDMTTGGASDALRAQADAPTKEGAD